MIFSPVVSDFIFLICRSPERCGENKTGKLIKIKTKHVCRKKIIFAIIQKKEVLGTLI